MFSIYPTFDSFCTIIIQEELHMGNNEKMVTSSNAATNGNMAQNDHVEKSKAAMPAVSRTFKSTIFIMLFEDKRNLLELYNAISGTLYLIFDYPYKYYTFKLFEV